MPGFKTQILVNMRGDLKFMELHLQPVYPHTLWKKAVWKIKLQKCHKENLEVEDYGKNCGKEHSACHLIEMLNQEVKSFGLSLY